MTIEKARREDIPAIAALERAFFSAPATEEQLLCQLESGQYVMLCAREDGEVVGSADYQFVLDEGYIGNVAVKERFRRKGVGEALVQSLLREAEERSLAFLTLEVREGNAPARALYEKCGFTAVGRRQNYYEKPREDAILMTAFLTKEAQ